METYKVIGLMSGTSLDGTDLAACEFHFDDGRWSFRLLHAETIPYSREWYDKLKHAPEMDGLALAMLHKHYGAYLGSLVNAFCRKEGFTPDFVASHGHTVFHRPEEGLTLQAGDGAMLAAQAGFTVICDFRSTDVALGGQGAPLVPAGDRLLFHAYDCCLNLGGFSNISWEDPLRGRIACDISPCNMPLNETAALLNLPFDPEGSVAASGKIIPDLLEALNKLEFYFLPPPKSLGREWYLEQFQPLLRTSARQAADILASVSHHVAFQVAQICRQIPGKRMLVTGGGARNIHLIKQIKKLAPQLEVVVPDPMLVDYKEALVFAFLGVLRFSGRINTLASVTGASRDHCGGAVYLA
ncbi:MAG TPA: anhydro-N-acetylmuramic acid kinase [Bacteroidales bacterium]|nr:anhydro-N-acetylmuramic acid kinase [Bacteroidales bacterium]HSA43184.1 anhydro-N-acetylmuramic acid kinase [Bacteroidales bacterium]